MGEIDLDAHRAAARKSACESAVLLKNDRETLPLSDNEQILLVGALSDNGPEMAGTWSMAVDNSRTVSIKSGLENAGVKLCYLPVCAPGGDINEDELSENNCPSRQNGCGRGGRISGAQRRGRRPFKHRPFGTAKPYDKRA